MSTDVDCMVDPTSRWSFNDVPEVLLANAFACSTSLWMILDHMQELVQHVPCQSTPNGLSKVMGFIVGFQ